MALLASVTSLESLNISRCGLVSDNGMQLLQHLTNLKSLNLHGCRQLADDGLSAIAELTDLQVSSSPRKKCATIG